jgi:hypothetical protein
LLIGFAAGRSVGDLALVVPHERPDALGEQAHR